VFALSPRFSHPHHNAAPNKVMFELGDRANNMKQQPACRTARVEVLLEAQKIHAQPL
jgi:hypothetical protein